MSGRGKACASVLLLALTAAMNGQSSARSGPSAAAGAEWDTSRNPFARVREALDTNNDPGRANAQTVPALNGAGLLSLDEFTKPSLIYGFGVSSGWDSNPAQLVTGPQGSGLVVVNPYFGVQGTHRATQYVIQYAPTFTHYTSGNYGNGWLHTGSAWLQGAVNERWHWTASADASYGQDNLRFLAPVSTVAVGGVAGLDRNAAAYQSQAGQGVFLNANLGLSYLRSERDSYQFSLGNAFSGFQSLGGDNGLVSARLDYIRRLSPTVNLTTYAQTLSGYGATPCESVGGGVGATWQVRGRTSLEVDGGPLFTVAQCEASQNYTFNAAFSTRLSALSQIYVRADRQYGSGYLGPGLWQNSAAGGYQRTMALGALSLDAGYTGSTGLTSQTNYEGVFVGGSFGRQFGRGLDPSVSYRRIVTNAAGTGFNRQIVLFSLTWNSAGVSGSK